MLQGGLLEGFPESLWGRFRGVSETTFFCGVAQVRTLEAKLLERDLDYSRTQARARAHKKKVEQFECELELELAYSNSDRSGALKLDLEPQA